MNPEFLSTDGINALTMLIMGLGVLVIIVLSAVMICGGKNHDQEH